MTIHRNTTVIKWDAPEYVYVKNSNDWFWGIGILSVSGVVLSVYYVNYLFAVLILVGTFLLVVYSVRQPDMVHVEVSSHGILADKEMHNFAEYEYYWIHEYDRGELKLLLHTTRKLFPLQTVPISQDVDINHLRDVLQDFLEEREIREPVFHRMMDHFGF